MIAGKDVLQILSAIVPMYFVLLIAYASIRWLNLFSAAHSAGINRFLRVFSIPFLSFTVISSNNLYNINLGLFAADSLQKLVSLAALFLWKFLRRNSSLDWMITLFSLSSLPNTLIIGLPMATAMYGAESASLMVQTLVFQGVIWINVLIVMFEYRAAKIQVSETMKLDCDLSAQHSVELKIFPENPPPAPVPSDRGGEITPVGGDGGGGSGNLGLSLETSKEANSRSDASSKARAAAASASGMTKLVLYMLGKRVLKNPNTYASLFGVVWSLTSFKYGIKMPTLMHKCISMLSDTGLALSMFSLGTFMAVQPNIIACSMSQAATAMAARFLISPMLVAAISMLVGLHGIVLHTAIIQAAFPQGVLSFVLAKEYNVHPNVLSTSVVVGMLIAFPIILMYYMLLGAIWK